MADELALICSPDCGKPTGKSKRYGEAVMAARSLGDVSII
jgi:hypothetical protein